MQLQMVNNGYLELYLSIMYDLHKQEFKIFLYCIK